MYNFNTMWEITQTSNPALASHVTFWAHEVAIPSASGKEKTTLRYNETHPKSPTTGD